MDVFVEPISTEHGYWINDYSGINSKHVTTMFLNCLCGLEQEALGQLPWKVV